MNLPARSNWRFFLSILLVLLGCMLRLVWLDADPDYYIWEGYIIDEGRWIENARRLLLFDELLAPSRNVHLVIAPLYQALSLFLFMALDISRWTVRLLPAVCGCLLLFLLWRGLRPRVHTAALVLAAALLAGQEDLLVLSRISIPEMPAMLLEAAAFLALLSAPGAGRALLAGVLTAACLGMKATTAPIAVVFGLVAWMTGEPARRQKIRRTLAFFSPILAAGAAAATAGLLAGFQIDFSIFTRFIGLTEASLIPYFFFSNPMGPTFYLWALPVPVCLAAVLTDASQVSRSTLKWWTAAAVWTLSYLPLAASLRYFPDRYLAHMLPPLALLAALSVHILLRIEPAAMLKKYDETARWRRLVVAGVFVLPAAVCLAAPTSWFLSLFDLQFQRMRWQIPIIVSCCAALAFLVHALRARAIAPALIFPLAFSLAWFAGHQLAGWRFWNGLEQLDGGMQWLVILPLAMAVALLLSRRRTLWGSPLVVGSSLLYLVLSLYPFARHMVRPTYTIPETSRELAILLEGETDIVSHEAEGLFIDTKLRFESQYRRNFRRDPPATVVSFELPGRPLRFPAHRYEAVKSYDLHVSPRYSEGPAKVVIYRLSENSRQPGPAGGL